MAEFSPGPYEAHFWDILDNQTLEPSGKQRMTIEYRVFSDISVGRALAELCFENKANAYLLARSWSMLALLEKALPMIQCEASNREAACDNSRYAIELRDLANEISAEIDKAYGKGVGDG